MALGSVNRNLQSFEELRKLNIPLDTEPAITFRPYLPGKKPTGKATPGARLRVTKTGGARQPHARADRLPAGHGPGDADRDQAHHLDRAHQAVSRSPEETRRDAQVRGDADRGARARSRRRPPMPRSRPASIAARCTAFRGAPRICSRPRASRPPGARRPTRIRSSTSTRPSSSGCATPARCSSPSCRWARWRRAASGSAARRAIPGTPSAARAARPPVPARPPPPASSASRSAPKRSARSSRRRSPTASPACVRPTAASAATAPWRSAGRWTRLGRCADRSKTACWC